MDRDTNKYLKRMLQARLDAIGETLEHTHKRFDKLKSRLAAGDRDGALESLEWLESYSYTFRAHADRLESTVQDVIDIVRASDDDE